MNNLLKNFMTLLVIFYCLVSIESKHFMCNSNSLTTEDRGTGITD